ncbi:MAG: Unknown protein [uncultured Sulfurovum sp.]|uniref:Ysc84 actin-binding domain-containing protein n=1 Tax=uncultured Sulfurovum sp. TaxID=269237 RepID=A0A6S6U0N3_9BACT|nr:MAG: Unknown protein [uncultured Sulfurovum sp.]
MNISKYIAQVLIAVFTMSTLTFAQSAKSIEKDANKALEEFYNDVAGSKKFLAKANGYVVFPEVTEAGFIFGGRYGEGVLRVNGVSKSYHSIASASVGPQIGAQTYSLIIVFTSETALRKFIHDDDWEADMDFNIAMAEWNSEEELDEIDFGDNMIGFVFDSAGLMGNFTMEGTRFEKINP